MLWLKKLIARLMKQKEASARADALKRLRLMSPREQVGLGLSPKQLREGVKAWPWRYETDHSGIRALSQREIRRAEAELGAYTDRELAELGIGRGDIASVVRHGRPGLDRQAA